MLAGQTDDENPAAPAVPDVPPAQAAVPVSKILFVTSEMGDFVKTGGLGEVSATLPRALGAICETRVLTPGYRQVRARARDMAIVRQMPGAADLPPWSLGRFKTADGLTIYAVLCDELYDRPGSPYGEEGGGDFPDNDVRFARLSLAAAEIAAGEADPDWRPDILHVNDWPSALAPGYLAWRGVRTPSILTIHNLAYQGLFDSSRLRRLAIPDRAFSIDGAEFYGKLSFLKSGIYYASHVTTVSETYAREIMTPEHGCGLDGLLRRRGEEGRLSGILNGIDDSWIAPVGADPASLRRLTIWKEENAGRIREIFGLAASTGPLFSIISRLIHQKGIDLSIEAAETIVAEGGQLAITGRGDRAIEEAVQSLARRHPGAVAARIGFDESDARAMFAGSDFLLMPSRFEPCGLSQMYAQRSGSLPIAYRTGGLADTIEDGRSGFLFSTLSGAALAQTVRRAFQVYKRKPFLRGMRRRASSKRFDWLVSARRYAQVYSAALSH